MNSVWLLLLLLVPACPLTAQLQLLEYDPLLFQLTFSAPVNPPSFQILYNNVYDIPFTYASNPQKGDTFTFQGDMNGLQSSSNLQSYDLLFNSPLTVGGGTLQLSYYALHAQKSTVQISFPSALGIFILACAYFFNMFTQIGKLAIEFMQIYTLYMFHNNMTTTIYKELYMGLLLIPPSNKLDEESFDKTHYILVCLILPLAIICFLGAVGYLMKKLAPPPKDRSILGNIVYEELTFNSFIKATRIFSFNLLFNSIIFIKMSNAGYGPVNSIKSSGSLLIYFNLITLLGVVYLKLYILNPRLGQTEKNWQKYIKTQQFQDFRVFHGKCHLKPWYKRNYSFQNSIRIIIIISFFSWKPIFQYVVLLVEFAHVFYIFTVRPFKQEFYINVSVICRLLFLAEYLFIVLGNLYYSIGSITYNYYKAYKMVIARDALFLTIVFGFFIAVFFEIYLNCSNLNYYISVVREENQFNLKIISKKRDDTVSREVSKTKNTTSYGFSTVQDKKSVSSKPFDSVSDVSGISRSPRKSNKKSEVQKEDESSPRGVSKSKAEIQMIDMKKTKGSTRHKRDRANSERKKKWNQSLLEGMIQKQK